VPDITLGNVELGAEVPEVPLIVSNTLVLNVGFLAA
jgi:hypothetical protein